MVFLGFIPEHDLAAWSANLNLALLVTKLGASNFDAAKEFYLYTPIERLIFPDNTIRVWFLASPLLNRSEHFQDAWISMNYFGASATFWSGYFISIVLLEHSIPGTSEKSISRVQVPYSPMFCTSSRHQFSSQGSPSKSELWENHLNLIQSTIHRYSLKDASLSFKDGHYHRISSIFNSIEILLSFRCA